MCVCAYFSLSLSFPLSIMYTLISERMCIMDYNINSTKPRMHVNMRDCWSQPGPCTKRQESSGRYKGILQKMVKPHSRSRMVKHGMFSSCQPIHVYIYIYICSTCIHTHLYIYIHNINLLHKEQYMINN